MEEDMIPVLENRWILKDNTLKYYGLRNKPNTFKNTIKVSSKTAKIIKEFNKINDISQIRINNQIKTLINKKVIVDKKLKKSTPSKIDNAIFCKKCCLNDYIVPGIEFDKEGICPVCANMQKFKKIKDVIPVVNKIEQDKKSDYDIALFYTGGKDSTFLLYYLAKVLNLKVLALTWQTPFMSLNAINSMNNAKSIFANVHFITKKLNIKDQKAIYKKSYDLMNNTCICPFAAYPLFIDLLRKYKIKYLVLGNEPAQPLNLIFNKLAPKIFYYPFFQASFRVAFNMLRIIMGRRPLKKGQIEMLLLLETLAFGKPSLIKAKTVRNPLIRNIYESLKEADSLMHKFQQTVTKSSEDNNIPALIHMDFNDITKNKYIWKDIKTLLIENAGWEDVNIENKGLHTSCKIEKCKEYSQFQSFKNMDTDIIPFSAIELSIAINMGSVSREEAIIEIKENSGFFDYIPEETAIMIDSFK